jgi:hypothetical protein
MANTNSDSDLSAPLNDGDYAEDALLTSNAASQHDTNFPSANPPPKSSHSRTASDGTNVTSALNQPLNIVVLRASFAWVSVGHAFLETTLAQLRTTSKAPDYRLILVSQSTHFYWNIGAPHALVAPGLMKQDDLFIPTEPGFLRHKGYIGIHVPMGTLLFQQQQQQQQQQRHNVGGLRTTLILAIIFLTVGQPLAITPKATRVVPRMTLILPSSSSLSVVLRPSVTTHL